MESKIIFLVGPDSTRRLTGEPGPEERSDEGGDKNMCYNCGCMDPKDPMGSEDNITDETFAKASKASNQTPEEAMENTYETLKQKLGK